MSPWMAWARAALPEAAASCWSRYCSGRVGAEGGQVALYPGEGGGGLVLVLPGLDEDVPPQEGEEQYGEEFLHCCLIAESLNR